MACKLYNFMDTLGYLTLMKIVEIVVFLSAFIVSAELLENFRGGGLGYSSKVALGVVLFYGVILLYWPLSFGLLAWLRPKFKWFVAAEMLLYLAHSMAIISIAYNGVFGISDKINYLSPVILAWYAVTIVKATFVLISFKSFHSDNAR